EYNHAEVASGVLGRDEGELVEFLDCSPNLFTKAAVIRFSLPEASRVKLEIFDRAGRKVRTLVDGYLDRGFYSFTWEGRDERGIKVAEGVYFIKLTWKEEEKYLVTKVIKM
ncbi:MAG: hypothetical protein DRO93_15430, partial [Candidatus Thorarchaeota archaeon]